MYTTFKYRLKLLIGNIYIVINKIKAFIKDKIRKISLRSKFWRNQSSNQSINRLRAQSREREHR